MSGPVLVGVAEFLKTLLADVSRNFQPHHTDSTAYQHRIATYRNAQNSRIPSRRFAASAVGSACAIPRRDEVTTWCCAECARLGVLVYSRHTFAAGLFRQPRLACPRTILSAAMSRLCLRTCPARRQNNVLNAHGRNLLMQTLSSPSITRATRHGTALPLGIA